MPKKTTILIIVLTIITATLVYLAPQSEQKTPAPTPPPPAKTKIVPTPTVEKTATVYFSPNTIMQAGATNAEIVVDTSGRAITGVQVELVFDPKVVRNVKISAPQQNPFFGSNESLVLFNDVNQALGRASYAVAISPTASPKTGIGAVAVLSFTTVSSQSATQSTISFIDKTMVTKEGEVESVLKSTIPLTINLSPLRQQIIIPTEPQQ